MNDLNPRLGVAVSSSDIDNPSGVATAVATTNYHSLAGPSWIPLIPPAVVRKKVVMLGVTEVLNF